MPRLPAGTFGNDLAELYVVRIWRWTFPPTSPRTWAIRILPARVYKGAWCNGFAWEPLNFPELVRFQLPPLIIQTVEE